MTQSAETRAYEGPSTGDGGGLCLVREIELVYRGDVIEVDPIRSSKDVNELVREIIPDGPRELLVVLMIDAKKRPIGHYRFSGSLDATIAAPSDMFRAALHAGAHAIVLAHNHPSGDPIPSPDDIALTERVNRASEIIGIPLLDHVILGSKGRYFSFLDKGLLDG